MPEVDVLPDVPGLFEKSRAELFSASPERHDPNQRCIGIVTPGRMLMLVPAPPRGTVTSEHVAQAKRLVPSDKPLTITAVGCTQLEPLMQDKARCLPFLGQLLGLAYLGHSILVFEGHESAFEAALQGSDVLMVDSGMVPFLQKDWVDAAWRAMAAGARILVHERNGGLLKPVVRTKKPPGWRYGEPDGEASYFNCLLTTLAKRSPVGVEVIAGRPLPDLATIATDSQELEWVAELPFHYNALSAEKVIAIALKVGTWATAIGGESTGQLQAKLVVGGQLQPLSFRMRLGKDTGGVYHFHVAKSG
jgi:hypothetical protein